MSLFPTNTWGSSKFPFISDSEFPNNIRDIVNAFIYVPGDEGVYLTDEDGKVLILRVRQ